jgi:hypothetical protein
MFSRIAYWFTSRLPERLYNALPERILEALFWAGSDGAEAADRRNQLRVIK